MAESASRGSSPSSLFQVYLRLRPLAGLASSTGRFITVEPPVTPDALSPSLHTAPTHITLNPPSDRRRAIEKFEFTRVFEEDASQLDLFHCTDLPGLVESILAPHGGPGTDALLATLGVTGSGKSHTILGSQSQRGLTQLALDLLFRSIGDNLAEADADLNLESSIKASDVSEAFISIAPAFIDTVYGDSAAQLRSPSRSRASQIVRDRNLPSLIAPAPASLCPSLPELQDPSDPCLSTPKSARIIRREDYTASSSPLTPDQLPQYMPASARGNAYLSASGRQPLQVMVGNVKPPKNPRPRHYMSVTASATQRKRSAKTPCFQGDPSVPPTPRRHLSRPLTLPQIPDISTLNVPCDPAAEYVVLVSMYEVYNDRIFDLLTPPVKSAATKDFRRRPLLFKSTELSPDRKIVAGLRKILCCSFNEALMVIEAGLNERRVAGTGSNSVSSRSHGFFSIEVKKRKRSSSKRHQHPWTGNALTVVDLAGSERARDAKTAGATLAEAGKINESLMYLGQCLQMQSDLTGNSKPSIVPFRQCKLTELLFSNSFPSSSALSQSQSARRNLQKAVMIVTADAHGDYNATSQILRYSALAREIAVPRVPSLTETILEANAAAAHAPAPGSCGSLSPVPLSAHVLPRPPFWPPSNVIQRPKTLRSFSPASMESSEDRVTMEHAALEIARLSEENRYLREYLAREQDERVTAEAHLLSMEDRMLDLEQAVREDCVAEFEQRLAVELARWKAGMQVAIERGEEHWDRKMDVFERSLTRAAIIRPHGPNDGIEDKENILVESLEEEKERLRREVTILKRELAGRSPSKRVPLIDREDLIISANGSPRSARSRQGSRNLHHEHDPAEIIHRRLEGLTLKAGGVSENSSRASSRSRGDGSATPIKKVKKLTTRQWEGGLNTFDDPF